MNRINIICLGVSDMARSIRFYRNGLGFETNEMADNPDGYYWEVAWGPDFQYDEQNMLIF